MSDSTAEESVASKKFHQLTAGDQATSKPRSGSLTGSKKFKEASENSEELIFIKVLPIEDAPEASSEQPRNEEIETDKALKKSAGPSRNPSHKRATPEPEDAAELPGQQRQRYSSLRMRASNHPPVIRENASRTRTRTSEEI